MTEEPKLSNGKFALMLISSLLLSFGIAVTIILTLGTEPLTVGVGVGIGVFISTMIFTLAHKILQDRAN